MDRKKRIYFIVFLILGFLAIPLSVSAKEVPKLIVFFSPTCHKCAIIENEIMPEIKEDFKGKIQIEYRNIAEIENYKLLLSLQEKNNKTIEVSLPVFYMGGNFLNSKGEIENNLKELIDASLGKSTKIEGLPEIDLVSRFKNFVPLAIIIAGLEDGINPCAFTVIVFFISFLALQGYRKKELLLIGLSFILAVFLTYFLIGLGIFNFFYSLRGLWALVKAINISVGILSILLGVLSIYDFFKFRKSGRPEDLILQLPKTIKNRIHSLIGLYYRKGNDSRNETIKPHAGRLISSALITGFLISLLEAVCTGQLYLPTITFVFRTSSLKLQAFSYLLLYNLMFITPLLIIFLFALLGITSEDFSRILKRHLGLIKLFMAALFFTLGIFLLWRG